MNKLSSLTLEKFGIESIEIVYPILLKTNGSIKLVGDKAEQSFIKLLKDNNIKYEIYETIKDGVLNGRKELILV